ncbi:hypothetical protein KUV51_00685 [Tateyamaria omphalii]|uniref:hypothetical protein n=1 Tax=Tateyamaria omphalii TaxID=299262 RepID=UPI001C997A55|nr:hypothetical protein [Tateyamaria omphalii]MBY5931496.1 hypothetical protein [Tateyamaria omphalii]
MPDVAKQIVFWALLLVGFALFGTLLFDFLAQLTGSNLLSWFAMALASGAWLLLLVKFFFSGD